MVDIVSGNGVTAIVVSKDLEGLLRFCLDALQRALSKITSTMPHEVVLVDNASGVPYLDDLYVARGVVLLRFDTPQSFARVNNLAAARRPNDLYLLLNNDVLLEEDALVCMLRLLNREPGAGICGSRLIFPDGTIQHCGVVFGPDKEGPYHCWRGRPAELVPPANGEYQAVTGACMLARRLVWEELGGLDQSYPFGLEDIDFCLRARQRGWRVMCCNEVASLHFESLTPGRVELDIPSRRRFMERWGGRYTVDG